MKKKILIVIILSLILSGCSKNNLDSKWGPQIDNLYWGMSKKDAEEYYTCTEEQQEVSPGIYYQSLKEPVLIYGIEMDVILIFEENYGLTGVQGKFDEKSIEDLQNKLDAKLGDHKFSTLSIMWWSDLVSDCYDREQIERAYNKLYSDLFLPETFITGRLYSPLVSYKLFLSGKRKGTLVIDGSIYVYITDLISKYEKETNYEKE